MEPRFTLALAVVLFLASGLTDAAKPLPKPSPCTVGTGGCLACRNKKCSRCTEGMGPSNKLGTCVACTAGASCASCEGDKPSKCTACVSTPGTRGTYADSKGACLPCKDAGCAVCQAKSGSCKTCLTGMALKGSKCVACGAGMIMDKGRCKKGPANCLAPASAAKCTPEGCAPDFVFNASSKKCESPVEPEPETPETPDDDTKTPDEDTK